MNEYIVKDVADGLIEETELIRCKDCRYFEKDHWEKVSGFPLIVSCEICLKWGGGCKTSAEGYCFMAERKEE